MVSTIMPSESASNKTEKTTMSSPEEVTSALNVLILERKLFHLEKQMNDLKIHVIESERKVAQEKRRKLDSKFKQKFKQQKLPAWQPILTADTVLPAFFLIGLLFIPLGVALLYFSNNVQEHVIDYTDCLKNGTNPKEQKMCKNESVSSKCICEIDFFLEETFEKNVYFYYGLENFYQNHRRYVKSRDDRQLYGKNVTIDNVDSSCDPFGKDEKAGKLYAPCGAIANSLFNDTLTVVDTINSKTEVKVNRTGIAWPSDKKRKFKNPPGKTLEEAFKNTIKPIYWDKPIYELDPEIPENNGYQNEDLIVWMRTAAFPSFRKLYRKVDHTQEGFKNGMPMGNYTLKVEYTYPVNSFGGRKLFIISTTSFLGGKNNFLGIAYITVGATCLLLGVIFLIIHIKYGKRPTDLRDITQNTPFSD